MFEAVLTLKTIDSHLNDNIIYYSSVFREVRQEKKLDDSVMHLVHCRHTLILRAQSSVWIETAGWETNTPSILFIITVSIFLIPVFKLNDHQH